MADSEARSARIHSDREDLAADEAWINKLSRFFEHDPQVYEEIRAHILLCETCRNVVTVWEERYNRHDFLAWAHGRNGASKYPLRLHVK